MVTENQTNRQTGNQQMNKQTIPDKQKTDR